MQGVFRLFLAVLEKVAEGEHLGGANGGASVRHGMQPLSARLGERDLCLGQLVGSGAAEFDSPAVSHQGGLFRSLAEGQDGLQFELETFHRRREGSGSLGWRWEWEWRWGWR